MGEAQEEVVPKKFIIRLAEEERKICGTTIDKLKDSSQKA